MMSKAGGLLAIVGVIACPITSGDTAFRSARLILAYPVGVAFALFCFAFFVFKIVRKDVEHQ